MNDEWSDAGSVEDLSKSVLQRCKVGPADIAVSCVGGVFGAVHHACNHVGGPLGEGTLDGDYIVCPWHQWKFHRQTGVGEPGFEADMVPSYPVKVENGRVMIQYKKPTLQAAE